MAVIQHETTIAEAADRLSRELPRHRVEILQGRLIVTPPPADGTHALTLSWLIEQFYEAGAKKAGLRYVQGIGIWLPAAPPTTPSRTSPSSPRTSWTSRGGTTATHPRCSASSSR